MGTQNKYRKTLEQQFESKYVPDPNSGCWLWTGALSPNGYGHIRRDGKILTAHRAAYKLYKGEIIEGLDVCHICDIRCCVNPNHLFLGTRSQNLIDMRDKGRHNKKLTWEEVKEILESYKTGVELARKYNISNTMVHYIRNGIQWKS